MLDNSSLFNSEDFKKVISFIEDNLTKNDFEEKLEGFDKIEDIVKRKEYFEKALASILLSGISSVSNEVMDSYGPKAYLEFIKQLSIFPLASKLIVQEVESNENLNAKEKRALKQDIKNHFKFICFSMSVYVLGLSNEFTGGDSISILLYLLKAANLKVDIFKMKSIVVLLHEILITIFGSIVDNNLKEELASATKH